MPSEDQVPYEPDLSLPEGSLDPGAWDRILSGALAMPASDIDPSIVPEFDEYADADEDLVINDEELDDVELDAEVSEFGGGEFGGGEFGSAGAHHHNADPDGPSLGTDDAQLGEDEFFGDAAPDFGFE